jgi:curved DNA-binding protein CbpA
MKDYYEILGTEEDASGEKIRAHWRELVKPYHPDLERTEGQGKRIAYEILKNESARFGFDLEKTLKRSIVKKARSPKESRMNTKKIILPAGMLVLFVMVGLISLRWLHVGGPPELGAPDKRGRVSGKRTASQTPAVKTGPNVQGGQEIPKEIKKEAVPEESEEIVPMSEQASRSAAEHLPTATAPVKVQGEVPAKDGPKPVKEQRPQVAVKPEVPARVESEVPEAVPEAVAKVDLRPAEKMAIPGVVKPQPVPKPAPPPLLAREEEVKHFFSSYIDRYNRKDIDGFLSFFSSGAVQNQKDGLEGIRSIYTKFFDQSRQLRVQLEGMKTEIYQNAVEVKARFKVDQILKRGGEGKVWAGTIHCVLVREDGALKIISLNYQNQKFP